MTMLCDRHINAYIRDGRLGIDPYDPELLQPASLDVRLSDSFQIRSGCGKGWVPITSESVWIRPGQFLLGCTTETLDIPDDLAVRIEGKSTWGRRGLLIHSTAGFIDPGFTGQITLEMSNVGHDAITVLAGTPIGQLSFHQLCCPAQRPYSTFRGSHYQGQRGATPPHK